MPRPKRARTGRLLKTLRRSTRARIPAICTLITPGTKARRERLASSKSGMTGSSPTSRGSFEEPPVVYELKDKKGSLINFDFANGLYTVPKLATERLRRNR